MELNVTEEITPNDKITAFCPTNTFAKHYNNRYEQQKRTLKISY